MAFEDRPQTAIESVPFIDQLWHRLDAYKAALASPGLSTLVFEDEAELMKVVRRFADDALAYAENKPTQPA